MCGIFGITGTATTAADNVFAGLKNLEYRGYDSWGVALRSQDGIEITKHVGKISDGRLEHSDVYEAVGHSRWATHGGVTLKNSHPHRVGEVVVVHNGIFENYLEYKTKLEDEIDFKSETDSEVIAALIHLEIQNGVSPQEALSNTAEKIEGRFAILVLFDSMPGLWAVRRGSPLILGRGEEQTFIASDIPAFLEKTNVVNYLDDNQMAYLNKTDVDFWDLTTGEEIEKRNIEVEWDFESAEKGEHPHFMIKEILEQKETIARAINQDKEQIDAFTKALKKAGGIYIIGCGTAHKAAMATEYFFAQIAGKKVNVVAASEMESFKSFIRPNTALVCISQSGETADIMEVVEYAQSVDATVLSITNVASSSLARASEVALPVKVGPEKAVASTKATTGQMTIGFLLAHAFADTFNIGLGVLLGAAANINDMINPRYEEHIESVAKQFKDCENLFIIGRGSLYPMALEAAIKIQEVSYIHAQGFAAGELKHGPIALIEEGTPCIVLGDDQGTISNAIELKSRGAVIIGISTGEHEVFDHWMRVPDAERAQPLVSIIPIQILSYHFALLRGHDPDMPRNLAKSVTVK